MSSASSVFSAPALPYDSEFDRDNPAITLPKYANDLFDDCVIAARAHQTVRFDYSAGKPITAISDLEVAEEFHRESAQQGTSGLVLETSLLEWMNSGWQAGGIGPRKIANFWGPYGVVTAGSSSNYPANEMNEIQVMAAIFGYTGVQVQLNLPRSIGPDFSDSFGTGTLWSDTTGFPLRPHAILLTGYDANGPIGITWGAKQHMTWAFLQKYIAGIGGLGLFVVERDGST